MWCKRYFEQQFPASHCRLFPTQNLLFQFLDSLPPSGALESESLCWLPFSIELHSEAEVSQRLSSFTSLGTNTEEKSQESFFHFRKRDRTNDESEAPFSPSLSLSKHFSTKDACTKQEYLRKKSCREAFSLLYGDDALSLQTRFFLACTIEGLKGMLEKMAPGGHLHLYEIIREDAPCHLYFDVECEGNLNITVPCITVDDVDEGEAGKPEPEVHLSFDSYRRIRLPPSCSAPMNPLSDISSLTSHGSLYSCRRARPESNSGLTVAQYNQYVRRVRPQEYPPQCCPASCPCVTPHTRDTTEVLLRSLYLFIQEHYPQIFQGNLSDPAHPDYGNEKGGNDALPAAQAEKENGASSMHQTIESIVEQSTFPIISSSLWPNRIDESIRKESLPLHYRCWKRVVVLRSKRIADGKVGASSKESESSSEKFSQHYIFQMFNHKVWENNKVVGYFVKHFVQYLHEKMTMMVPSDETRISDRHSMAIPIHSSLFFHSEVKMWNVPLISDPSLFQPIRGAKNEKENALVRKEEDISQAKSTRVVSPEEVTALPFLVRKCFVDTAVYSKNRMMRCLYSAKLHKSSVLQVEQDIRCGRQVSPFPLPAVLFPTVFSSNSLVLSTQHEFSETGCDYSKEKNYEEGEHDITVVRMLGALLNSLISSSITHLSSLSLFPGESQQKVKRIIALAKPAEEEDKEALSLGGPNVDDPVSQKLENITYLLSSNTISSPARTPKSKEFLKLPFTEENELVGVEPPASLIALIQQQYSTLSGKPCFLDQKPYRKGAFFLYTVHGSRYCQNVRREHKSNNVYIVVDMLKKVWSQKCFDPDCARFRGNLIPF